MPRCRRVAVCAALILLAGCGGNVNDGTSRALTTSLVSRSSDGVPGNGDSLRLSVSGDGRFIAFYSAASGLVAGVSSFPGSYRNYLYDCLTGEMRLLGTDGFPSGIGSLTGGGRYWVGQGAGIYVVDRIGKTEGYLNEATGTFIGFAQAGTPTASADGRYIAYIISDSHLQIGVHDRDADGDGIFDEAGETSVTICSMKYDGTGVANDRSHWPSISADGRFVVFQSEATDLVSGYSDGTDTWDIFLHDRDADEDGTFDETGAGEVATYLVSKTLAAPGAGSGECDYPPSLSSDGRYVIFRTSAGLLNELIPPGYENLDLNSEEDDYVWDRITDELTRVSVQSGGVESPNGVNVNGVPVGRPYLSGDGSYALFIADGLSGDTTPTLGDVYKHDLLTRTTSLVSVSTGSIFQANNQCYEAVISADGETVLFTSSATNLVEIIMPPWKHVYKRGRN
jgi:Tol biopolymer transport system component